MAKQPDIDIDALLEQARPKAPGYKCRVCTALGKIDDATVLAKLKTAIADRESFTVEGLCSVLDALGFPVSKSSMERHRRQQHD